MTALVVLLIAGCAPTSPTDPRPEKPATSGTATEKPALVQPTKPAAEFTASEILQKLLATYRGAESYQDDAVVRLSFQQGNQPVEQEWPAAVAFERPNKLSLVAYQATVKCDGRELRAKIDDPDSGNVDNQVVVRSAPKELKLTDLASDQLLYDILSSQLRRQPIQLELLLESGGLVSAFGADVACRRLDDEQHDGRTCFRVEVPSPGGPFVFWVDQAEFLLRRLDYPAAALVPDLTNNPEVSDVQLLADLRGAHLGGSITADEFTLEIPAGAKRMKTFVVPPRPLPTQLLGKVPEEFYFTDLAGDHIGSHNLTDKITVLVWYHDNPVCEATLQQVSLARERLKEDAGVIFYAVATDPRTATGDDLEKRLADWKVALPIVRDLEAVGDKSFRIAVQPTIVVLDGQGSVQIFQAGGNPQLADQLVEIASRLKEGDDMATEILERHAREQKTYDELVDRGGPEPGELVELPEAVIRMRNEPKTLKLKELWSSQELKSPGNILLVEQADQPARIFVFEGWRSVAELDQAGKLVTRHELELPDQAAVTFARSATDKNGDRYFIAAAPLSPQVFVFDGQWKLLRTFPAAGETPLAVVDLALADLGEADGTPEMLTANVSDLGLVAHSLEGEVLWRTRAFPNVASVAPSQPDDIGSWALYLAGDEGTVVRVSRFGREEPPVKIGDWPVLKLTPARFAGAKQAEFLALSNDAKGELFAVGVTGKLKEAWNYPLPAGVHQKPIEPVTSSNLLPGRQGEWWLAGPDGSVHVITEDGEFHDAFHTGAALTGLAATNLGGKPVLLIATDGGVTAWEIE
jgi:hypothetical protein